MANIHILYLDNNSFFCNQVKMRLEWTGYQIEAMDNEHDFLTKLRYQTYDLLIIDFLTPRPNAIPLLENLNEQYTSTPTIIVSEYNDCSQIINIMQLGCIDYVLKAPLVQNYVEQLNYSIFQSFEKLQHQITESSETKNIAVHSVKTQDITRPNWEYYVSTDLVQWLPPHNHTKITIPYDEFTAKIHQDDYAVVKTQNNICLFTHEPVEYTFRYLSDNDRTTTFHIRVVAEVDSREVVKRLYGHMQELSSQPFTDQNQRLKLSFFDNTADAVFITDAQKRILSVNDAFITMSGYSKQDILNKKTNILNTKQFDTDFFNNVIDELKNKSFWQGEVLIRHHDGHSIPVWQSSYVLKDAFGDISQSISVLQNISEQKHYEESIKTQANYDSLTQLPNRTLFIDRLTNAIKQTKRNNGKLALMLLDLNKFKWINDTLGHHAGDILLQETAKILQSAVRSADTVARLGGDEFSIIVPELGNPINAELIVSKIFNAFKQAILIDQQEVFISGSIGISIFPDDGTEIDTLQKNADSAMYIAKTSGYNSYYFYTQALQKKTEKRLKMIEDMRSAMLNQEFTLHFQPIIDIETNKVSSAETLLRWNHPQAGYVPLNDFIPIAEETGLIREIGNWVIEEVAVNIKRWSTLGLPNLHISLNQSVTEYNSSECHVEWLDILKKKQIPPHSITFEITEKVFMEKKDHYQSSLKKLKHEGIQISLDGFGTGYSSLSYLKKFPVDVIKIDRSYINSMLEDPTNAILVETMVVLANKLGVKVIATGVENKKQLAMLNQKCRYVQGYYFSRPLPLSEFESYIKKQNQIT